MPSPLTAFPPGVLAAANINPATGLATDYLNHYNEVAMLIGMLDDMPEAREDILGWEPVSYPEHFIRTHFKGRDLAIAAYAACPPPTLAAFEQACAALETAVLYAQAELEAGELSQPEDHARGLYALITAAGNIINGEAVIGPTDDQAAIDALFADA
jgi:hypothetical protein